MRCAGGWLEGLRSCAFADCRGAGVGAVPVRCWRCLTLVRALVLGLLATVRSWGPLGWVWPPHVCTSSATPHNRHPNSPETAADIYASRGRLGSANARER